MKKTFILWIAILSLPVAGYVANTNIYDFDFSDAKSVVEAATDMMMNADFQSLLTVTEGNEYLKTQTTLNTIEDNPDSMDAIEEEMEKIIDFEIISSDYYTNDANYYSIVKTRWYIEYTPTASTDTLTVIPDEDKTYNTVYVDYLLQKYNAKWKIISQKSW